MKALTNFLGKGNKGANTAPGTVSAPVSPTGTPATNLASTAPARLSPTNGNANTPVNTNGNASGPAGTASSTLASPTSSNTGYVPTYEDVKTYVEKIRMLAADYNENPIPLWIIDPLSEHLSKISTTHNRWGSSEEDGGVFRRIAEPVRDGGIEADDFNQIAELLNEMHVKKDAWDTEMGFDKAVLTTWWVLKRRGVTVDRDPGEKFSAEFIQNLSKDEAFIEAYHDAWAMAALFDLIPAYTAAMPTLRAIPIGKNTVVSGMSGLVVTVIKGKDEINELVNVDANKKSSEWIKVHIERVGDKDDDQLMRMKDLWQLIEAKNLATNVAMMDVVIGASFLRLLNKMETDTYGDVTRNIPDIKTLIPVKPATGGAKKKRTASGKKKKATTTVGKGKKKK